MTGGTIAKRYARALLGIGVETNSLDTLRDELDTFAAAYEASDDLRVVMHNPSIIVEDRKALIRSVARYLNLGAVTTNFLQLLIDKDRAGVVVDIAEVLGAYADEEAGILRARVTAATELDGGQKRKLQSMLSKLTGKKVMVETDVDPDLLGGLVTRVDGRVYDGSLRMKLDQIQKQAAGQL